MSPAAAKAAGPQPLLSTPKPLLEILLFLLLLLEKIQVPMIMAGLLHQKELYHQKEV